MIIGQNTGSAYLITEAEHPESFWAEIERKAGQRLSQQMRQAVARAADTPMVVDWNAEPIRIPPGARFSPMSSRVNSAGYVTPPGGFTRTHLA